MSFTYPQWDVELLRLINERNNSAFQRDELTFTIDQDHSTPDHLRVNITPGPDVPYYGDSWIVYGRRDLSKAFLGLPLRFAVKAETRVSDLVTELASRYGLSLDTFIDFAEEELNKVIDFSASGLQTVTIPVAETSYVWSGELEVVVANDLLNLENIIKNVALSELRYLGSSDGSKASTELVFAPIDWTNTFLPAAAEGLTEGSQMDTMLIPEVMKVVTEEHDIVDASVLQTYLSELILAEKRVAPDGKRELIFEPPIAPTGLWRGNAVYRYQGPPVVDYNVVALKAVTAGEGNILVTVSGQGGRYEITDPETNAVLARGELTDSNLVNVPGVAGELTVYMHDTTTRSGIWVGGKMLTEVKEWGPANIIAYNFNTSANLTRLPTSIPATVENIDYLVAWCPLFNQDLSGWDVSNITSHTEFDTGATAWEASKKPVFA